ncbi:MAG: molybdopterin cofactor-binding domain-containing protein, partial [Candidatus Caldarchaeum sp.]
VEFRLKNVILPGHTTPTGEVLREDAGRVDHCIKAVAEKVEWGNKPKPAFKPRGKGIAALWKAPAMPPNASSSAIIKFNDDGTAELLLGITEIGQGSETALAQIAAEELGVPIEKIKVVLFRHTDVSPYSWQTVASRGLFMDGKAVQMAAKDAKAQILEIASQVLRVPKEDLALENERVFFKGRPELGLELRQVVNGYTYPNGNVVGGPVIGRGIGMVHQEFTLATPLTVAENIALMLRKNNPFTYPLKKVEERAQELSEKYGLKVNLHRPVEHLSLGERQRVEILKVLFWEPSILILDEPTSVLTLNG